MDIDAFQIFMVSNVAEEQKKQRKENPKEMFFEFKALKKLLCNINAAAAGFDFIYFLSGGG